MPSSSVSDLLYWALAVAPTCAAWLCCDFVCSKSQYNGLHLLSSSNEHSFGLVFYQFQVDYVYQLVDFLESNVKNKICGVWCIVCVLCCA